MSVHKRNKVWYYRFSIRGVRYGSAVPEARTKWQTEQAEAMAKDAVFSGRYDNSQSNTTLKEFVENQFCPGRETISVLGRTMWQGLKRFPPTSRIRRCERFQGSM